jgi:hypothetical protein
MREPQAGGRGPPMPQGAWGRGARNPLTPQGATQRPAPGGSQPIAIPSSVDPRRETNKLRMQVRLHCCRQATLLHCHSAFFFAVPRAASSLFFPPYTHPPTHPPKLLPSLWIQMVVPSAVKKASPHSTPTGIKSPLASSPLVGLVGNQRHHHTHACTHKHPLQSLATCPAHAATPHTLSDQPMLMAPLTPLQGCCSHGCTQPHARRRLCQVR